MWSSVSGFSCLVSDPGLQPSTLLCLWHFPGKDTWVGCHSLLQGIFLTQGWNPCLVIGRQVLCMRCSGLTRVVARISMSLYEPVTVVYPFISRRTLGWFPLWAIVNNATVDICVQVLVTYIFHYLGCMPRSGTAGLCSNYLSFEKMADFSTAAIPFAFSISSSNFSTSLLILVFIFWQLTGSVRQCLIVALTCISLESNDVGHRSMPLCSISLGQLDIFLRGNVHQILS